MLQVAAVAFAVTDVAVMSSWWQGLLGGTISYDDEGTATLAVPGGPALDFSAEPVAKPGKNRLHLDLRGGSFDAAVREAVDHGATRAYDVYDGDRWAVLRDPEGNEFCILRGRST